MEKINWINSRKKLKDLLKYEKNPRILNNKQKKDLTNSLKKFGLVEVPIVDIDNTLIAGHQRCEIMMEIEGGDYEIDVRIPDRKLTEKEFEEYLIRSNKNTGSWNWDILNDSFESIDLIDYGFDPFEVEVDKANIDNLFADMEQKSKKIKVKQCEVCKKGINMEVKYFIKNKTFDSYNFKDNSDKAKLIYERIKDLISDEKIHIIFVENNDIE